MHVDTNFNPVLSTGLLCPITHNVHILIIANLFHKYHCDVSCIQLCPSFGTIGKHEFRYIQNCFQNVRSVASRTCTHQISLPYSIMQGRKRCLEERKHEVHGMEERQGGTETSKPVHY